MKIILASKSPRRAALMELAQIEFEIIPGNSEEKFNSMLSIEEQVSDIAYKKALDVFENTQGDRAIIGADTIVVKNNKIFGKPKDRIDAIKMLKQLQGDVHKVYTALSVLIEKKEECVEYKELFETSIKVKPMTDEEIIEYVDSEQPYDKAGSYAIQSSFCKFVEEINGNYMSVVGLPIDKVYEILKENEII